MEEIRDKTACATFFVLSLSLSPLLREKAPFAVLCTTHSLFLPSPPPKRAVIK